MSDVPSLVTSFRGAAVPWGMFIAITALLVSLPPPQQAALVDGARAVLGVPYVLGGRLRRADDGLDCQGLLFFALQAIEPRCGWRSWSVMPTTSVQGELGLPVAGAAPVATAGLGDALPLLQPGDVIWFVDTPENPAEPAIATLADTPVWVWHTGLYVGGGRFIAGDHFAGRVVEEELVPYAQAHYAGIFVTRMVDGPLVRRCRRHPPMRYPP